MATRGHDPSNLQSAFTQSGGDGSDPMLQPDQIKKKQNKNKLSNYNGLESM
jgi:hypothetical protein